MQKEKGHNQKTEAALWTEEEDKKLLEFAKTLPMAPGNRRLARGGRELLGDAFPERSYSSVLSRYKLLKQRFARTGKWGVEQYHTMWTAEEEEKLRELYSGEKFHLKIKKYLKEFFPTRDYSSIITKAGRMGLSRAYLPLVPFQLSEGERGMAAGMINGDGSIGFYQDKERPGIYSGYASFSNTDKAMIDWFEKKIPRGTVKIHKGSRRVTHGIKTRQVCYYWQLRDKPTLCYFLEMIVPYLIGSKQKRAQQILEKWKPIIAEQVAEYYLQKAS